MYVRIRLSKPPLAVTPSPSRTPLRTHGNTTVRIRKCDKIKMLRPTPSSERPIQHNEEGHTGFAGRTGRNNLTYIVAFAVMIPLSTQRLTNIFAFSLPKLPSASSRGARLHRHHDVIRPNTFSNANARMKLMATDSRNQRPKDYSVDLSIPTTEDMEDIGGLLSVNSTKGDILLLDGDLGAGKTCFSRGFIRYAKTICLVVLVIVNILSNQHIYTYRGRTGLKNERVTSPTYLLSNTYPVDRGTTKIYHMDLYRLSGEEDLAPLSLEHVFANGISLIEWSSRLIEKPPLRLDIMLSIDSTIQNNDDGTDSGRVEERERRMKLVPHGDRWLNRLKFLESEGYFEDLILCEN